MYIKINNHGISFMEITVVLVIVGIAFLIAALNWDSQMKVAYNEEARAFINLIADKEKIFYASHNDYVSVSVSTDCIEDLGVNLRKSNYYGQCTINVSTAPPYTIFNPQITVNLFGKDRMAGSSATGQYDAASGDLQIVYN